MLTEMVSTDDKKYSCILQATEDAFSRSLWEQRSHSSETQSGEQNGLFALYNPAEKHYFVITIDPDSHTPRFRLSGINDVKTNGAFAIEPPGNGL